MVRTLPYGSDNRIDVSRILGYAAAIALHALALLLLLIPMTAPQVRPVSATPKPEIRWIEREKKPETVPIKEPTRPVTKVERKTETRPQVAETTPLPNAASDPVIVDNGNLAAIPANDGPTTDVGPVAEGPISVSSLSYVKATPPPYPRAEMTRGAQGTVVLRVLVGIDGLPLEVSIETSSGNRALDQSALRHVKKTWRFQPAIKDGQAVQAYGLVPIVFSLQ